MYRPGVEKWEKVGETEIVIERGFRGPRLRLFEIFTKPELLKLWLWDPAQWTVVDGEVDLKVGGQYGFRARHRNNAQDGVAGYYREIVRAERLVYTETFLETYFPGEVEVTLEFAEDEGQTDLRSTRRYKSTKFRDEDFSAESARWRVEYQFARIDKILIS